MDNNELLNAIQKLLEESEQRTNSRMDERIDQAVSDIRAEIRGLTARVDVVTRLMETLTPALLSFMTDAVKSEAEVRLRLGNLETRIDRLANLESRIDRLANLESRIERLERAANGTR